MPTETTPPTGLQPNDTIIALASGAGRAGVAVLRVSGSSAGEILRRLFHVKQSAVLSAYDGLPPPRRASVRTLLRPTDASVIDEALVLWMPGPDSFTGEDVAELHVHGGAAVIESVLTACIETGLCRLAEPGEFTRRAFEAGRLDLTQAEGLADLIDAETEGQRVQAQSLFSGAAGQRFEHWRARLIEAMAAIEAAIDFPDEADVPEEIATRSLAPLDQLEGELEAALADWERGRSIRDGFRIAILGKPNAGKSSLLNQIAGRDAAIVSPIAGTTRDVVEVRLVLAGFPVWLADTAGLREAADAVELEGVRRALERAQDADLRIWLLDSTDAESDVVAVSRETSFEAGDIIVWNKADLVEASRADRDNGREYAVSAHTGAGVSSLVDALSVVVKQRLEGREAPTITRARHRALTLEALDHIRAARAAAEAGVGYELVGEDVRMAARALGRITGKVDVEDLLDRIFSDFCIGK